MEAQSIANTGTWIITNFNDSGQDETSDFNMFFSVSQSSNFEDLNDDWDIVSVTENRIELRDVSGGNGGTDILVFEKN